MPSITRAETIPHFTATVHGGQRFVSCNSEINVSGSAHRPVVKTSDGWLRFSAKQAVEAIATNEIPRLRNYIIVASRNRGGGRVRQKEIDGRVAAASSDQGVCVCFYRGRVG